MRGLEGVRESDRVDEGVGGCKGERQRQVHS